MFKERKPELKRNYYAFFVEGENTEVLTSVLEELGLRYDVITNHRYGSLKKGVYSFRVNLFMKEKLLRIAQKRMVEKNKKNFSYEDWTLI